MQNAKCKIGKAGEAFSWQMFPSLPICIFHFAMLHFASLLPARSLLMTASTGTSFFFLFFALVTCVFAVAWSCPATSSAWHPTWCVVVWRGGLFFLRRCTVPRGSAAQCFTSVALWCCLNLRRRCLRREGPSCRCGAAAGSGSLLVDRCILVGRTVAPRLVRFAPWQNLMRKPRPRPRRESDDDPTRSRSGGDSHR